MFSQDADSPVNLVEIRFLHYSCGYWEFPRKYDSQVGDLKYVIIGPCIPSETTKSWHHGENLMKLPEFFVVSSIFLKWMGNKYKTSVIRQKGESQNGCFKKTKHAKFSEKRTFLTLRTVWVLQGVNHFSNKCYSTVYTKLALDLVGEVFQKNDIGEWGDKKLKVGVGGIYHGFCHGSVAKNS